MIVKGTLVISFSKAVPTGCSTVHMKLVSEDPRHPHTLYTWPDMHICTPDDTVRLTNVMFEAEETR